MREPESEASQWGAATRPRESPRRPPSRGSSLFCLTPFGLTRFCREFFAIPYSHDFFTTFQALLVFFDMPSPRSHDDDRRRRSRSRYSSRSISGSSSRSRSRSRSRSQVVRGVLGERRRLSSSPPPPPPPPPQRVATPPPPPPSSRHRRDASRSSRHRRSRHRRSPSPPAQYRRSRSRSSRRISPRRPAPTQERPAPPQEHPAPPQLYGPTMAYEDDPCYRIALHLHQMWGPMCG